MMSEPRGSAVPRVGFVLARPKHALVRRAVDALRARMDRIHSMLLRGELAGLFSRWLAVGLVEEEKSVGRHPGRTAPQRQREQSGWLPSMVFALESALAEWSLGRAALRLGLSSGRSRVLLRGLPLHVDDLTWPSRVLDRHAESNFLPGDPTALASALYQRLLPRHVRHDLGVYHTPAALARFVVDVAMQNALEGETVGTEPVVSATRGMPPEPGRWMDPSCGFGVFPLVVAERMGTDWPGRVMGRDVSPLAVLQSRVALLELSVSRLGMDFGSGLEAVVEALRLEDVLFPVSDVPDRCRVDVIVGNPPWVTWDRLVPAYRERIKSLVSERPYLYDRKGFSVLMGGSTDDISALFTALSAERYLRPGGLVAVLLKTVLLTNETGSWFRALRDAEPSVRIAMVQVEDLSGCRGLFGQGGQQAMVFVARKTGPAPARVPMTVWRREGRKVVCSVRRHIGRLEPSVSGSRWLLDGGAEGSRASALGSDFSTNDQWFYTSRIHHGLKHDAEDVFVFTKIESYEPGLVQAWPKNGDGPVVLETGRLFRYVKPRHIQRWHVRGWEYVLVPQDRAGLHDEEAFAAAYPESFAYLDSRASRLRMRRSRVFQSGPFYGMFGVGKYTWDRYRLLWSGLGYRPLFCPAMVEDDPVLGDVPVLPDSGCYSLSVQDEIELWYLVGLLNSQTGRRVIRTVALGSKRPLSKTAMSRLDFPAFDRNRADMLRVAKLARRVWKTVSKARCRTGSERGTGAAAEMDIKAVAALESDIDALAEVVVGI